MLNFDDNKKIGISLLCVGIGCFTVGTILLFDRAILLIGNLAFIAGLYFLIGLMGTITFFTKKGKRKGSALFFGGFLIIAIFKISSLGFVIQCWGLLVLFKSFFPFIYESACGLPFIGGYLREFTFLRNLIERFTKKRKPPV